MNLVKHFAFGGLVLCSLPTASAIRAADGPPAAPLEALDVFELEHASDPQISPDGGRIAYVRNSLDLMKDRPRSELWRVNVDGAEHRPVVTGPHDVLHPRWSPDGTRLAYVSKEASAGPAQIYCRWMSSGETARLTHLADVPDHLIWSPDGRSIAFVMLVPDSPKPLVELPPRPKGAEWADPPRVLRKVLYRHDGKGYLKEGFRHVFIVSAEGGMPRQLTSGNYHHEGPLSWSPDSKAVFCSANRDDDWEFAPRESEIYSVSLADGEMTRLTHRQGPDDHPVAAPDGRSIAWLGFDDQKLGSQVAKLYVMDRDGKRPREITPRLDRNVASPVWSSDARGLYFQYDDTGTTKIGYVTLAGEISELAAHLGGVNLGRPYASGSFSADGRGNFAYTQSQPDYPADVAVGKKGGTEIRRITRLNDDLFGQRRLSSTEEFWFKSSADGRKIQGWVVRPPGFDPARKYPLILEIHGGPFANYGDRFSMEIQLYAAAGYVVLYVNPRGSTGYGEEFANLIHHAYPGQDYDDLMSGVDAVLEKGYVDRDQLYVTGGSGGGILTAWIVGKTSRFRAAVAVKPVINWYSFALTSDIYPYFNAYWFPGVPWKNAEHFLRRSPISLVENVVTPTMLMTGEEDHRTPISESEQFYQALKLRKVDTALVRIPGASHAIEDRPSRLITKVQHVLKWFEMHRQDSGQRLTE
ncbi:MAG: prolyl oligopeptidase family serine peptidase [Deltaproteobacteria bacterium]